MHVYPLMTPVTPPQLQFWCFCVSSASAQILSEFLYPVRVQTFSLFSSHKDLCLSNIFQQLQFCSYTFDKMTTPIKSQPHY